MTPADLNVEVALRVNAKLARNPLVGGQAREWLSADWVGRILTGKTDCDEPLASLIRETAAQVTAEIGGAK